MEADTDVCLLYLDAKQNEFVAYLVDVASSDASWEKMLQLNASLYHHISLRRYDPDRQSLLDTLKQKTSEWSCASGSNS